jgi:hypothetical protein
VHVPHLGTFAEDLSSAQELLRLVLGRRAPVAVGALIAKALWGVDVEHARPSRPTGLALDAPAGIGLDASLRAALVILPLADAERFASWLASIPAPTITRGRLPRGTAAWVLSDRGRRPLACVIRERRAVCQVGSAGGGLNLLEHHFAPGRSGLGAHPAFGRVWVQLERGALWTALARPVVLARSLVRHWGASIRRARRFHPVATRRAWAQRIRRVEEDVVPHVSLLDAAALQARPAGDGVHVELLLALDRRGVRRLDRWIPQRATPSRIRAWAATPALFSLFLQVNPALARDLARSAGAELPEGALDGTLGLMAFGVDSLCPHARRDLGARYDWAFLFPSAATLGLRAPDTADVVHRWLARGASASPPGSARGRAPLEAEVEGGKVAIHVLDDLLLAGTGPMGGLAGLRRLAAASEGASLEPEGFFRAALDFGAIAAALEAARIGADHRSELRTLEHLRRRLAPLLHELRKVRISGRREARGRVRIEAVFGGS